MSVRRGIFAVLTILWMALIFAMSARVAVKSTADSEFVGMAIGRMFVQGFADWDESEQLAFAEKIDYQVRKAAHAAEYGILVLLCLGALYDKSVFDEKGRNTSKRPFIAAFIVSALYAASDEFHQLFVEGRSGMITDVIIDSAGAALSIVFMYFILCKIAAVSKQGQIDKGR